ncbi:aminotransferase class V-fold PLP-dependent enzyme [Sphingomonas sp. HITSZ_GF]|uniref:cysteine desulfurase family protein n=1 Tax=Sphingomonas sp. HITSZ_GF TaxID=3037247 RepID=UPI00240E4562|nr:aminotransferase class V-fold PLP-dependent enzyme [Sphingomonas sp. HITSZ_GF]MDG2532359.1 aminotransferase class V-fold PLP-dependent enzyme [Sphingomonas sp. HITSZ_GF]
MPDRIYLDHAATTPMLPEALAAVETGMRHWANPSSPHGEGRAARAALEKARSDVAAAYGWAHELIFTSGASESLHLALTRSMAERRLISAVEHDSVLRHAEGAQVLPVDGNGVLNLDALRAALAEGPRALVGVQRTNSETGVIQPIEAIAEIVHAAGGILLVDAAQMPARASAAVLRHADLVAVSAHKRGGPPGIGALLVRDFGTLLPMGGQEKGYRAGTENLPGALGYAAAVSVAEDLEPMFALRTRLEAAISAEGAEVVGAGTARSPLIGAYRMPGVSSAAQLIRFDMAGISVSAGSACSSGSMRPSHVLSAMGWEEPALREVVRVSFGRGTSEAEVDAFTTLWRQIAIEARTRAA